MKQYPRHLPYNKELNTRSRDLRAQMTQAEKIFWYALKEMPWFQEAKFNRQKPIGNYIVDFYCHKYGLVIEIDGDRHFSVEGKEYDLERSGFLEGFGLIVLRFTNVEIFENLDGVIREVESVLRQRGLVENPPAPPHKGTKAFTRG